MKRNRRTVPVFIEQLDCFGDYTRTNPLCAKYCVLRLRCAIEQDYAVRMEVISDLATADYVTITVQ